MWRADIYYRTDAGLVDIMHHFDELVALRDLIGRGPNWYTRSGLSIRGQIAECAPARQKNPSHGIFSCAGPPRCSPSCDGCRNTTRWLAAPGPTGGPQTIEARSPQIAQRRISGRRFLVEMVYP
jgi:hypothetical protein